MLVAVEALKFAKLESLSTFSVAISEFAVLHEIENVDFGTRC
jgi:hypothetical protein